MTTSLAVFSAMRALLIAVLVSAAIPSAAGSCAAEAEVRLCGKSCDPAVWCSSLDGAPDECVRSYVLV